VWGLRFWGWASRSGVADREGSCDSPVLFLSGVRLQGPAFSVEVSVFYVWSSVFSV